MQIYPTRAQCGTCHLQAAGGILGLVAGQLNRTHDYGGVHDEQLRTLEHLGLFGSASTADAGRFVNPHDTTESLYRRVRGYLAANCAQCHLPGGPTNVTIDLRAGIPAGAMDLVNVRPTAGDLGLPDAYRVKPGVRGSSVLWERVRIRGANQMPPLATSTPDPLAVRVIGDWIDAGAP